MTTRAGERMLVCIRSFGYYDDLAGGQVMRAGVSHVVADHDVVQRFPENFALSDRSADVTREGRPIAGANLR